ncbi:MAG: VWA domain-containing protein [Candidatus Odinarchaeota archaeon]
MPDNGDKGETAEQGQYSHDELLLRWRMILGADGEKNGLALNSLINALPGGVLANYSSLLAPGQQQFPVEAESSTSKTKRGRGKAVSGNTGLFLVQSALNEVDGVLQFCYDQQSAPSAGGYARNRNNNRNRGAGSEPSQMTVPSWVSKVKTLFPSETREILEADLIKRRGIEELIETPELLEKVEPSLEMAKLVLTYKDLMSPAAKESARRLIRKVVDQVKDQLRTDVIPAINGALRKDKNSPHKVFKNLNLKKTIWKNLKNWDEDRKKVIVDQMFFHQREQKRKPWHIITVVDESGSMMDSVIYSAVLASIFWEIPSVNSSLVIFDTQVVDLTPQVKDPVETLMNVRLGGGTYIGKAMQYVQENLIINPAKTIVVLITDFYEGMNPDVLLTVTKSMIEGKARVIGLAALGYDTSPCYDRHLASQMRKIGVDILACTPKHLSELIGAIIGH